MEFTIPLTEGVHPPYGSELKMRRLSRLFRLSLALQFVTYAMTARAQQLFSYKISMEAVDHYGNPPSSIVCIQEADNYRNQMLKVQGVSLSPGVRFTDKLVFDTDFTDPDRTGQSFDSDTYNFDRNGDMSAYFCGHGTCDDLTTTACTSSSQCNSPPGGSTLPGACIGVGPPNNNAGVCGYARDRKMIVDGSVPQNHRGGFIDYSNGATVKWGENYWSGSWGGAAENGGNHFAIISNSCGLRPPFWWQEVYNLFSGTGLLGIAMPVTPGSDDVDAPDRGTFVAQDLTTNLKSAAGTGFNDAIYSMAQNEGGDCPGRGGSYAYGGGHGITGCGAHVAVAVDSSLSYAQNRLWNWPWVYFTNDAVISATGNNYMWLFWSCNYDCNTYKFTLP